MHNMLLHEKKIPPLRFFSYFKAIQSLLKNQKILQGWSGGNEEMLARGYKLPVMSKFWRPNKSHGDYT